MKAVCLALAFLSSPCTILSAQQSAGIVGIVRSVSGGWTLQGHTEALKVGQPIREGDVAYIAHSNHARLVIGLFARAEPWEKNCTDASPCEGPYGPPKSKQGGGFFAYLLSYFSSDAERKRPAIFAGARDPTPGPQHAVLVRLGDSIALNPTLSRFPAGQYKLNFTPLDSPGAKPAERDIAWDGSSTNIPAIPDGFYALDVYSTDNDHIGSHAAILVIRSEDRATQQRWQQSLLGVRNAAGPDAVLSDNLRLDTVLALKNGDLR